MATMIPGDIEEFGTEGEEAFYKFLEGVAKPDAHYLCRYLPDINGNEPDFLLYCEEVGLMVLSLSYRVHWVIESLILMPNSKCGLRK
jgi:hypothetical protein